MRILVCCATSTEAKACQQGIADSEVGNSIFEVLKTGVGLQNARTSLVRRISKGSRPDLIVSSGLAGALREEIPHSAWVSSDQIFLREKEQLLQVKVRLYSRHEKALVCSVVSGAELMLQAEEPAAFKNHARLAVDMESAALAQVANEQDISFMVLRMISDTPQRPLPKFLSSFAAAMASPHRQSQLMFSLRGIKTALANPRGIAHILKEGRHWAQSIRTGWSEHAVILAGKIDEIVANN